MTTATTTKPKTRTNPKVPAAKQLALPVPAEAKAKACKTKATYEDCEVNTKHKGHAKKKKKPMYKLGCWRGAFKGTLDF